MKLLKRNHKSIAVILSFTLALCLLTGIPFSSSATNKAEAVSSSEMLIGAGIGDITGPITEISTGYNSIGDVMNGLLMRLYARAFIVASANGGNRVVYVSAEMLHMTESIKPGVIKELQKRGLGSYYTTQNVMLAATHCHSAPSNVSWYPLYDDINGVPGFDDLYYKIIVQGIADAIQKAHNSLKPGYVEISAGDLDSAAYNRSSEAYSWNVDASDYPENINKEMVLLRFEGTDGSEIGELNWFGVHGTSNSIDNTLVSSDNKGYAAYEFEQLQGSSFVAAFAQSECGDASPNKPQAGDITAAFLRPSDEDPTLTSIDNEAVTGQKQLNKAVSLYNSATVALSGAINYRYTNVDFSNISYIDPEYIGEDAMPYDDITEACTSVPCIGAGIMAGDEEGAPVDYAEEGEVKNTFENVNGVWVKHDFQFSSLQLNGLQYVLGPLWPAAMTIIGSNQYSEVQKEKVVCLPVGNLVQTIQPLQIFTIGELAIVGVPFEVTTMEARRIKAALLETLAPAGINKVVLSTLTNSYSQYVTTREEFAAQNYEGATNLYGPWSGAALTQELDKLCQNLVSNTTSPAGSVPADLTNSASVVKTSAATTGVVMDGGNFGRIVTDVQAEYSLGDTVTAVFEGASPRNVPELRASGKLSKYYNPSTYTYMEVQKKNADGSFTTVRTDKDPFTTFLWARVGSNISPNSQVTLSWLLRDADLGTYRFVYNGLSRNLIGIYSKFTGYSGEFRVVS